MTGEEKLKETGPGGTARHEQPFMKEKYRVKRLMILGGSRYALPVIRAAHTLGAYVITCDYLPDNIAHRFADEYCNVSIVEKEAVLEKARELKIDGIMSFGCDPGVVTAAYVAEQMGLPSCGPYESVCILQNKGRFRRFLRENGFNVPDARSYTEAEKALREADQFHWPVIVKPTDSAGSKGVRKVEKPEELKEAIEYAMRFSRGREFIVEEFIRQKGASSDTDSFSVDGEMKFISFNAQRFDPKAENPYTPAAYSWPSKMSEKGQKELASEIQRLIRLLGMGTGIYNIETREGTDGKAYIMECAPRGGGNRLAECLEYATGVKLVENAVRAALGMETAGVEQRDYDGWWAEVILHSSTAGEFQALRISEEIQACVVEEDLWVQKGDYVEPFSSANFAVGTLILRFDDEKRMERVIEHPGDYIQCVVRGK